MFGYRKVGGLHFVRVGIFGASFYVSRGATDYLRPTFGARVDGAVPYVALLLGLVIAYSFGLGS